MPHRNRMRRLMQLGCILLLLFAQQAALTHALWHSHAGGSAHVHQDTHADRGHGDRVPDAVNLCAFDAALGQVLGAAPSGHHDRIAAASGAETPVGRQHAPVLQDFLAPHSRGPPVFLLS
jgi:hypothetical protein